MTFLTSDRFNGQIPNFAGPIFLSIDQISASPLTSVTCPAPTDPIGSKLTPNVTCSLAREGEDITKDRSTGLKLSQVWSFQSKLRPGWMPSQSPRVLEKQVFQGASTLVNPHHPPSCLPCIWDYIEDSLITWFWSRSITCCRLLVFFRICWTISYRWIGMRYQQAIWPLSLKISPDLRNQQNWRPFFDLSVEYSKKWLLKTPSSKYNVGWKGLVGI